MRLSTLLLMLVLMSATAVARQPAGPIDLARARALFAQTRTLSAADGGALWGRPMDGPILFVDPSTRTVVTNRADAEGRLRPVDGDLHTGVLPPEVSLGNTTTAWAGRQWTMLLWPVSPDPAWSGPLLMHECFHRVQPRLGIPLAVPDNHHLDTALGRTWLRLEFRALAAALDAPAGTAADAVRDALVFRVYRRSLFEKAAEEERALELNEGLAEYTGLRLGGLDDVTQRRRAVAALGRYDRPAGNIVRSFAYASGPAWGLLLDDALPRWTRRVRKKTDPTELLARTLRFRPPRDLAAAALARAHGYGLDSIRREEAERAVERGGVLAALRSTYVDGPVLVIPVTGDINFSFNPHDVRALDGVGTVYGTLHMSGPWGILDAPGGALVIEADGRRRVCVPAPASVPADAAVRGDGWTLDLARGWSLAPGPRPGDVVARRRR